MSIRRIVFDSWAILALFQDEPAAQTVEALLLECVRGEVEHFISVVNLGEIWYSLARKTEAEIAEQNVVNLVATGIQVVNADWPLTRAAAELKSRFRMSYADAYAGALAKNLDAELVTGDREFEALESELRIHWLKR